MPSTQPPARARRSPPVPPATERFRGLDPYRAHREWQRYEGTPQRDLYRELRERFLVRHAAASGWTVDVGTGPGRFLPLLGGPAARRVGLDISREMLRLVPWSPAATERESLVPERVLGDARRPPLLAGSCSEVAVMGNTLGFAESDSELLLEQSMQLVAPGGVILVESAPAAGERSRYLARLPASSVARLLRSPVPAVLGRLDREGFEREPVRRDAEGSFRRWSAKELQKRFSLDSWELLESTSVASALGPDAARIAAVRSDPKAWAHLLALEEQVGRRPERWGSAAALLVAARRPSAHPHD